MRQIFAIQIIKHSQDTFMPGIMILHPGREKSLLRKHPWIFSKGVKEVKDPPEKGGDITVKDSAGNFLATASYSPESQIRGRVWSFNPDEKIDAAFFEGRIRQAWESRQKLIERTAVSAVRVIDAESDFLPGLIIDRYNGILVVKILSAGTEFHLQDIRKALEKIFPDDVIYERSDEAVRKKEGLTERKGMLKGELPPQPVTISENAGMKILVDVENGHKTGFYLDQRDNRAALEKYCRSKDVLNCFSYTGGFSLYALRGRAKSVVNVDVSGAALSIAKENVVLNHLDPGRCRFVRADVFEYLRKARDEKKKFDVIVLDPPKFAESQSQLQKACRGYKDINMLAASLLNPGGILMTYSCSGHMTPDLFQKVVADALLDAGREGQIIEYLTQASDHPVALPFPEGLYLKGLVVRVN